MNRLIVWKFAVATAVTFAALSTVCAVAVIIAPDATVATFNNLFHGLDLKLLVPPGGRPVTAAQVISGVITAGVVSFAGGAVLAGCYNLLNRRTNP